MKTHFIDYKLQLILDNVILISTMYVNCSIFPEFIASFNFHNFHQFSNLFKELA